MFKGCKMMRTIKDRIFSKNKCYTVQRRLSQLSEDGVGCTDFFLFS